VVAPGSKGVIAMGERDFHPLSANFLLAQWLPSHWANYAAGKRKGGRAADPADWRIARTIFVADDERVALRYGRQDANSPYRYYWPDSGELVYAGMDWVDPQLARRSMELTAVEVMPRVNQAIGNGQRDVRGGGD